MYVLLFLFGDLVAVILMLLLLILFFVVDTGDNSGGRSDGSGDGRYNKEKGRTKKVEVVGVVIAM